MPNSTRFNVRTYGLWLQFDRLLVSDEIVQGDAIVKFPGGGVDPGEGPLDTLKREWREELGLEVRRYRHFYTTEFFQPSFYRGGDQLLAIYYLVDSPGEPPATALEQAPEEDIQAFRWISLQELRPESVTLPVDRLVVNKLLAERPNWP